MAAFWSDTGTNTVSGGIEFIFSTISSDVTCAGTGDWLVIDSLYPYQGRNYRSPYRPEPEWVEEPKAKKLRLAREASRRGLERARATLRASSDPPGQPVPRPWRTASRPLYERPVSKGRVCSGSARYRVRVN